MLPPPLEQPVPASAVRVSVLEMQALPEQPKVPHEVCVLAPQAPAALQLAAAVATPPVQDGPRQIASVPAKAQASRFWPSQLPPQEEPSVAQAVRDPRGAKVTGEQAPALPGTLQASHCPSQAVSQQRPSTQKPLPH